MKNQNMKNVLRDIIRHIIKVNGVQDGVVYRKIIGSTELVYDNEKDELTIIHRGYIGETMKNVNENIKSLGVNGIESLKQIYEHEEKGSPEHLYKLKLKM